MKKNIIEGIIIRVVATVVAALIIVAIGKWLGIAALGGMAIKKVTSGRSS